MILKVSTLQFVTNKNGVWDEMSKRGYKFFFNKKELCFPDLKIDNYV